ncbi:hypothetical protein BOX15_Mlig017861g5, partial [Macrostomum lignano]
TESSSGTSSQVLSVPGYPPFELGKSRFDQSVFSGRLRHFFNVIDPRTLLVNDSGLQRSVQLLEAFKSGTVPPGTTTRDLWEAQKVKDAILHPDTGKKIYRPFRMSGFVPYGTPIVVGLLLPHSRLWHTVFWQWLNQSHNAAVNYANRNASKETPVSRFLTGYVGAVSAAVSIAVGLTVVIRKANTLPPATKMLIQKFVPLPAVSTASTLNVLLMRNSELSEGIEVFDENRQVVGTSKVAAKRAIFDTAKTRAILPVPLLLIPPLVMTFLEKRSFLRRFPRLHLPVHALVVTAAFGGALPVAIALFPQISAIAPKDLEPELQATVAPGCKELYYNKGL